MSVDFNEEYVKQIAVLDERSKSNSHRIDDAEADIKILKDENKALYEMSANIKTLTDGVIGIKSDVTEIKSEQGEMKTEISDLKNAPMKLKASTYDNVKKLIFTAVVSAIVAFLLGQICPTIFTA